jgi:hypothetical protein
MLSNIMIIIKPKTMSMSTCKSVIGMYNNLLKQKINSKFRLHKIKFF